MSRTGKCTNFGNCVLAYRGEEITVEDDEFVCPECRQPLTAKNGKKGGGGGPRSVGGGGGGGGSNKLLTLVILAVILLLVVVVVLVGLVQLRRIGPSKEEGQPEATPAEVAPVEPGATAAPTAAPPQRAESSETAETAPEEVGAPSVPENLNLNVQDEQNRQVKSEVLKRIDLMPNISADNKDKLYFSVERARQMGKIVMIPFAFGQRELEAKDVDALREAIHNDRVQQILGDPTAVLVILGYADTKGDEQKNLKISLDRAEEVLKALRDKVGVLNVMHAVGMGGSTLFDEKGDEKNRVVEVWAVLP